MSKMKLSQNESNEAVCSCNSVCPYLHRLVRKYGNTKNKDKDFCTKYNVALRVSENREPLCCDECIKLFRKKNTKINQVKEYKENEINNTADIRQMEESIF